MGAENQLTLNVGGPTGLPGSTQVSIIADNNSGVLRMIDSTGPRGTVGGGGWRKDMTDFMRYQLPILDGAEVFSDFFDYATAAEQDWISAGNPSLPAAGDGGVISLGAFAETASLQPKNGNTGNYAVARTTPWAIAARGSVSVTAGASAFYGIVGALIGSNRFGFGYCGGLSTTNYCAWMETGSSLFNNPVVTNVPIQLHATCDQNFVAIFDGGAVYLWYGAPSGAPGLNLQPVGRMTALNNIGASALRPVCWARTGGGGAGVNNANYDCIVGLCARQR